MLRNLFKKKQFKIQSFTYYIPSPPERQNGYREKQFDKVFYNFINQGFEILSITTQTNTGPSHSGMWIVCIVRALNIKADELNLDYCIENQPNQNIDFDSSGRLEI